MKRRSRPLAIACVASFVVSMLFPAALAQESVPAAKKKSAKPMLRILCVGSLSEKDEVIVASKSEEGEWTEHGTVELRSSYITPWVEAAAGTLYLTRREETGLVPVGSLKLAKGSKRSIVVLLPNKKKKIYGTNVIDPEKLDFRKGTALVVNYSRRPALVMLGSNRTEVMPGKKVTARAAPGKDGMYRMVVGYQDEKKQLVPCYDRYIAANPDARDFLLLFPDPTTVLKVYSLSEFGPF